MSVPFSAPFPPSLPPSGNEMPITALAAISQTPSYPGDYFLLALCPGLCICIPKSPSLSYLFLCWLPIANISSLCSSLGLPLSQWNPMFAPSLHLWDLAPFFRVIFPPCAVVHTAQVDTHLEPSYLNSIPPSPPPTSRSCFFTPSQAKWLAFRFRAHSQKMQGEN